MERKQALLSVIGCSNGDYGLAKWKNSICCVHEGFNHGTGDCDCSPPFELFNFPTTLKNPDGRKKWIQILNRNGKKPGEKWEPAKGSRVCSIHFIDGAITKDHPFPTEKLGYGSKRKVSNIINQGVFRSPPRGSKVKRQKSTPNCSFSSVLSNDEAFDISAIDDIDMICVTADHSYSRPNLEVSTVNVVEKDLPPFYVILPYYLFGYVLNVYVMLVYFLIYRMKSMQPIHNAIVILRTLLLSAQEENIRLKSEIESLRKFKQSCICRRPLSEQLLKNDDDVMFYTGLKNIFVFDKLADYIGQYVRQLWVGPKHTSTKIKRKLKSDVPKHFGPSRKLSIRDQFLFLMMKLRLDPPLKDLSNRFKVSLSTGHRIFSSWSKSSAKVLRSLIFVPDQGIINATRPSRFSSYTNLNSIADCFEVFIQTPKDPVLQRWTWSSYKHHNTLKYFVSVTPNSMVVFLSKAYPGAISDKEITNLSGFLDIIPPYCSIMVDKGFKINEECAARKIQLIISRHI